MNRTDNAILELATAFCSLKAHNKQLYMKALRSLVDLAVSEEKVKRISMIETDMQYVGQVLNRARRSTQIVHDERRGDYVCRRKGDRRSANKQSNVVDH
ncbi:hypothetical protein [Herminiimonas aquatilis]|uniref:Uncharacterized protein n=1 Tax=Herminiimonas aquatilis TaxID=345342 RepID=A0ABW2J6F5_9BURK